MVQEALLSSPPSSYWLRGGLPSISRECISKYISSKYPLVEEKHHLDREVLIRQAILKLCGEGVVLWDSGNHRYIILPQFSTGSAASFSSWNIIHPPPPNYHQQSPPPSPPQPPQPMEEDTAEERHLALVPVDIKRFILLPTGRNSKIPSDPPPPYPPPLWEV